MTAPSDDLARRRAALQEAIGEDLGPGGDLRSTLQEALRQHMGLAHEARAVAGITVGLVAEVQEDTGADISQDPNAIGRIAEAYILLMDVLRDTGEAELDLPYLTATSAGPIHLRRTLTVASMDALARGEKDPTRGKVGTVTRSGGPRPPEPPTKDSKKKWWWPF